MWFTGNCLFNALSDQIYGSQDQHAAIRARVIEYMKEHAEYYKQFIDVHPGGGIRRNPKRKNAGAYASPANYIPPSQSDIDRVFESHLHNMARGGTYGDNMEITAFSCAYNIDVKIYQRDFAYMVSGSGDGMERPVAHIAYHIWEHYSSIRNLDGPHKGLPEVSPKVLSVEEEQKQKEKLAVTPHVLPWMIDVVSKSLPFLADKPTIKRAIEDAKGDVNLAVSNLLDAEENGSGSSQQESSSVERDHDSDDDNYYGPNKKQDRRMSRASKQHPPRSFASKHALSQLATYDGSQESIGSADSETSSLADPSSQQSGFATDIEEIKYEDSTSASRSASPARPPVRLKIHPPRPPDPSQRVGKTSQRQPGPRLTARDRKDMKKQAQKAARKERQQLAARGGRSQSPSAAGLALRQKGMTGTPPVETLRTLYI
jgi:OTU domain-containing protein 3